MELNAIDYRIGMSLTMADLPITALLAAAYARADTENANRLREAFPSLCSYCQRRYDAPGGILPEDMKGAEVDLKEMIERVLTISNGYLSRLQPQ